MKEPEIFCPVCGKRAYVVVWFTDVPGEGFGSANCPSCGGIDYKVSKGRVVQTCLVNPEDMAEVDEDLLSAEEYDRELVEYMLEQGLV